MERLQYGNVPHGYASVAVALVAAEMCYAVLF